MISILNRKWNELMYLGGIKKATFSIRLPLSLRSLHGYLNSKLSVTLPSVRFICHQEQWETICDMIFGISFVDSIYSFFKKLNIRFYECLEERRRGPESPNKLKAAIPEWEKEVMRERLKRGIMKRDSSLLIGSLLALQQKYKTYVERSHYPPTP